MPGTVRCPPSLRVVFLLLVLAGPSFGDILHLNNGHTVEGQIVKETDDYVVIRRQTAEMTIRKSEIERVERTKTKSDEYSERLAKARTSDELRALIAWCEEQKLDAKEAHARLRDVIAEERRANNPKSYCTKCNAYGDLVCSECGGTGVTWKPCSTCDAGGTVVCNLCRSYSATLGLGRVPCRACNGAGSVVVACPDCNGTGVRTCSLCGGSGRTVCRMCKGRGSKVCPTCLGGGTVTERVRGMVGGNWVWLNEQRTCPNCLGSGSIPCAGCAGKGSIPCNACAQKGWFTCATCGGAKQLTVRCGKCNGSGRVACTHCGGRGRVTCSECLGRGKVTSPCSKCEGKGRVTCLNCAGTGIVKGSSAGEPGK